MNEVAVNTYHGSACRRCGSTLRYIKGCICIACKKQHNTKKYTRKKNKADEAMDTPEQSEVFDSIENKADFLLNQLPEDRMKYLKKWRAMFEPEFVDAVREKLMEKLGLQELNHEQSCVCISCQAKETALGSL